MAPVKRRESDKWQGKIQMGSYIAIVGICITILTMYGTGVRWVQETDDKVSHFEEKVGAIEDTVKCIGEMKTQIAVTAEKTKHIDEKIDEIKKQIGGVMSAVMDINK